ncbi:four helix bundle protein [Algoriphagus sp. 4150]|uniref:four helix bundle protein n=1 Tax=Algoriphagus sp. 4150 TaxID=2817756 RepID=UPI0028598C5D|nr:four helix bundle protein [Algoriphagus sp. 4150]MDR7132646.1 four helix bundle protein [Algoriphagus sp. 4150]
MDFKFEKLRIWQTSMSFGEEVFTLSKTFPKEEIYNLTSQIRRAVDSIALNIAEGSTGNSQAEFRRFVGYSLRSLAEVVTCFHKAKLRGYINEESFQSIYKKAFDLMNSIAAFRNTLK